MADFQLDWTAGADATSQNVQYREKGQISWIDSINIDPVNPQTDVAVTADIEGLNDNTVYQFRIQTVETGKTAAFSSTKEKINFVCPSYTTLPAAGRVTIVLTGIFPTIEVIYFRLVLAATEGLIDTNTSTGIEAGTTFTGVAAGTYYIEFVLQTTVDGVTVISPSTCTTADFVIT